MDGITPKTEHKLITREAVDELTRAMLKVPQADCPVAHYFGPGVYLRQVTFPAGIFAIGHKQRFEQLNIFVQGRIAMFQQDGSIKEIAAPMIFNGPPGQKMGIILETVTWLNAYPNPDDCRDIDILEDRFLDKEGPWTESDHSIDRTEDREDYEKMLSESGFTEDQIRWESEFEKDLIDLPEGFGTVITVRDSDIQGKGIFVSWPFEANAPIGPVRLSGKRTPLGRYLNHAKDPNAKFVELENGDIYLISKRRISGCRGGDKGEEVTIDYRNSIKLREKQCQEQ